MKGERDPERRRFLRNAAPAVLGLAVAIGLSLGFATAGGNCISVTVADRFALPDGSVHDAARLSLCSDRTLSPVAGIHEISVDGVPVARAISRAGVSEGRAPASPVVLFRRGSSGVLDLVGFSVPEGKHGRTFLLKTAATAPATAIATRTVPAVEVDAPHAYGQVALRRAAD